MNSKSIVLLLATFILGPGWYHASPALAKEALCEKNASALAREGKMEQGIEAIRQCITKDPSRAKAHVILGYLLLDTSDVQSAMASFDRALELRPRSSAAKTGKGIILSRSGNLKEAEILLKDALKLNPNPTRTYYELGLLYEQLEDTQQALSYFKQGVTAHERDNR